MEISKDIYQAHQELSACSTRFIQYVKDNPYCLQRSNFDSLRLNHQFKAKPIQPWPTFINENKINEIKEVVQKVCDLIKSIPERIFNYDYQKMSDYYDIPFKILQLVFFGANDQHIKNLLGRGDFIFSSSGLKCIEFNLGSGLGGWELDLLEPFYKNVPVIARFLKQNHVQIRTNHFFSSLLKHVVNRAVHTFSPHIEEVNIALVFPHYDAVKGGEDLHDSYLKELYGTVLKQENHMLSGKILTCMFDNLNITDGFLSYGSDRIHAVIEMCDGNVPLKILHMLRSGKILLYNGPITRIMTNKSNLALLSQYKDSDIFNLKEREIIEKYIPWTRKIVPGKTAYGKREISLADFIISNKDELVIKPCEGSGGEDVFLGRDVSAKQWEELVERGFKEKNWLVQEYLQSLPYLYQWGENGCAAHQAVWGFFLFGSRYAGGFVRILPENANRGVVNTHQGAEKSIVVEVEE